MFNPHRRRILEGLSMTAVASLFPTINVHATSNWPDHPVNFIVPFPAGGPVDTTARYVTPELGKKWGVSTIVDNKGGAGGIVGAQTAAKTKADGYNLFFASIHHAIIPTLNPNAGYDILKDFSPVGMVAIFPIILVVNANLPVHSVSELISYAKAHPDQLSFGSSGNGGGTHLAGELFNRLTQTEIQHVPYRGSAPAMQDLLGGQIQVMFADGPSAIPHLNGGRIRALGIGNPTRSALLPDLPTIAESGVPSYRAYSWSGMLAPANTPPDIIKKVNHDLIDVLNDPARRASMVAVGAEPAPGTPEEFGHFLQEEITKWRDLIKSANITVT